MKKAKKGERKQKHNIIEKMEGKKDSTCLWKLKNGTPLGPAMSVDMLVSYNKTDKSPFAVLFTPLFRKKCDWIQFYTIIGLGL
jgi:hypothetical protein